MSPFRKNARRREARRMGMGEALVEAWSRMRPGCAYELRNWHDPECRKPAGEACTCKGGGPDVEFVELIDPEAN